MNNLKQIALAISNYQDSFGTLPPAYVAANDGTPLHSWRVLILPFLDRNELYAQYRFDEPWNGPNNRKLAKSMPSVYRCPGVDDDQRPWTTARVPAGITQYAVISGEKTAFPGPRTIKAEEIQDGTSNTIAVVELDANSGVHWLEPRDIDPAGFYRILSADNERRKQHPGGLNVAAADGSVHFLKESIDRQTLRNLTTANGAEKIPSDAY